MDGYTKPPVAPEWEIREAWHNDKHPFCWIDSCRCHYQSERMERYFIGQVERGKLEIEQAIDLYHCEPGYMARMQREAMEREAIAV